ncbi:MAG TPA: histidine phosphatase family protein [Phycisphaerae bacterium]|nr:histidine phosphatase family protein [Phycisphaerae bacterium]
MTARARRNCILTAAALCWAAMPSCNTQLSTVPVISQPGTTTTIILTRHAERPEGLDPSLTDEGRQRAQALADALADHGVTAIYAPDLNRMRETAAPVAAALGLEVNVVSAVQIADTKAFANQFVDEVLDLHAGGVVLYIGSTGPVTDAQSGNLQELYARLGGTGRAPTRYQDLYVAIIPEAGNVHWIKTEYGGPSSLD